MPETTPELLEVSKRLHNFGTKRFKEKSLFIFHACIVLKSLILLFSGGSRIDCRGGLSIPRALEILCATPTFDVIFKVVA